MQKINADGDITELIDVMPHRTPKTYRKFDTIYGGGALKLCLVIDGVVAVGQALPDGNVLTLRLATIDQWFGEELLVGGGWTPTGYFDTATVVSKRATIYEYDLSDVEHACRKPRFWEAVAYTQYEIDKELRRIARISVPNHLSRKKLAAFLQYAAEKLGTYDRDGDKFVLPHVSHSLIASAIGTTREVATLGMNELRREGWISYTRMHIHLHRDFISQFMGIGQ